MSEPIPESIPTSMDPRSRRPAKRLRQTDSTPTSLQAATLSHLFSNPSREINTPPISSPSDPSSSTSTALAAPNSKSSAKPPPEIVHNVQGSSAGAGSGEFHVYKASRRREYERLRGMDEEVRLERVEEEWEREREEREERDRQRTRRNREKRNKKKGGKGGGEKEEKGGKGGKEGGGGKVQRRVENAGGERDGGEDGGERADGDGDENEGVAQEVGVMIHDDD